MGAGLLAAGRNVVGGSSNEFVERAMAVEALVFGFSRCRCGGWRVGGRVRCRLLTLVRDVGSSQVPGAKNHCRERQSQ